MLILSSKQFKITMDKKTPPKSDTLSSQVLEYFRKYSRDQNLSSYLQGIRPQQESKVRTEIDVNKPVECEKTLLEGDDKVKIDQTIEREGNMSPSSSLTSNRKLEWDNGADIGYENSNNRANLHKSYSLPTLTTLEKIELGKKPLKLPIDNSAQIYYQSSSSSSDALAKPYLVSTTTSSIPEEQKFDTTSSSSFVFKPSENTLNFVHKKVGSPVAQSTPNYERFTYKSGLLMNTSPEEIDNASGTSSKSVETLFQKPQSNNKMTVTELKCVAKFTKSKIVKLSVTKPIAIDCVNYKQYNDKDIQTNNYATYESKAIQTEPTHNNNIFKRAEHTENILNNIEKQVIEYIKYSDSSEQPGSRSLGTNTDSDLVSNCNSFEYLCPINIDDIKQEKPKTESNNSGRTKANLNSRDPKKSNSDNQSELSKPPTEVNTILPEINSESSEKTLSSNVTEVSSKSMPLGEMISCNLSNHLNIDIERSISLLHRLLKSKRYDKVTKEYFVKKIVDKILKTNYTSDSSSSTNRGEEPQKKNNDFQYREDSSTSSKVSEKLLEPSLKKRLDKNVPWIPASFNKNVKPKKLEIKTFSTDIIPETSCQNKQKRKVKDSRFTITSSIFDQEHIKEEINVEHYSSTTRSSEQENMPKKTIPRTWKEDVTESEKLFESRYLKTDGYNTDSLVKFAKKERENQINWINDEISHLNKLRNLLQENNLESSNFSKRIKSNVEIEVLTKPHIEDIRNAQKSAAVYIITTDKTSTSKNNNMQSNLNNNLPTTGKCPKVTTIAPDTKECKLLSSELYKSDKPFTCIRRYVFEIPVECTCQTFPCKHELANVKNVASTARTADIPKHEPKAAKIGVPAPGQDSETNTEQLFIQSMHSEQPMLVKETQYIAPEKDPEKISLDKSSMTNPRDGSFEIRNQTHQDYLSKGIQAYDTDSGGNKKRLRSTAQVPLPRRDVVSSEGGETKPPTKELVGHARDAQEYARGAFFDISSQVSLHDGLQVAKGTQPSSLQVAKGTQPSSLQVAKGTQPSEREVRNNSQMTNLPLGTNNAASLHDGLQVAKGTQASRLQVAKGTQPSEREVRSNSQMANLPLATEDAATLYDGLQVAKGTQPSTIQIAKGTQPSEREVRNTSQMANLPLATENAASLYDGLQVAKGTQPSSIQIAKGTQPSEREIRSNSQMTNLPLATKSPASLHGSLQIAKGIQPSSLQVAKGTQPSEREVRNNSQMASLPLATKSAASDKESVSTSKRQQTEEFPDIQKDAANVTTIYDHPVWQKRTESSTASVGTNTVNRAHLSEKLPKYVPDYQKFKTHEERSFYFPPVPPQVRTLPDDHGSISDYKQPDGGYEESAAKYVDSNFDYHEPTPHYQKTMPYPQKPDSKHRKSQSHYKEYETPISSTSSTSTVSCSSQTILIKVCPCCNRKNSMYKSVLQDLPNEIDNSLCPPCHMNTNMTIDPETGLYKIYPNHTCNCYTLIKTETVNKIKKTVKQLEQLETERMYCDCSRKRCKCPSSSRSKKGIAYTLTLEDDNGSDTSEQEITRKRSLDEIKLKIPGKGKVKSKKRRKHHSKHKKNKSPSRKTLQEYLCANRPNFVQNAEDRRHMLIELAYMREQRCEKYKQLLAMTNGVSSNGTQDQNTKKRLYTGKEMRKITAMNYKKLPEVQKKLEERRQNNNKKANRLLADIFNKKIQQNVLKGKVDLSTTASVIKFI